MNHFVKKIAIQLFACLTISIIGLLLVNNSIFFHTHKLADGTLITHAHPYNKSNDTEPIKSHHHTKLEFIVIQNLGMIFHFVVLVFVLIIPKKKKTFIPYFTLKYLFYLSSFHKGRAPPVNY